MSDSRMEMKGRSDRSEPLAVRTLRILEYIADRPRSASDVAREAGVNRSSALRLLRDLEDAGYLIRDPTKNYTLAARRFARLAAGGGPDHDWLTAVIPAITAVRDLTRESTVVGAPANEVMIYMAFLESFHTVAARERLGTTRPMHASALGKAYLAYLTGPELDKALGELTFVGGTRLAVKNVTQLRKVIKETRVQGYALDRNETMDGISCAAVPMRVGDVLFGACGVSVPSSRVTDDELRQYGGILHTELGRFGLLPDLP